MSVICTSPYGLAKDLSFISYLFFDNLNPCFFCFIIDFVFQTVITPVLEDKIIHFCNFFLFQKDELNHFADDWYENVILVQNHKSPVLQQIAKEARREIKQMEKEFSHNGFLVGNFLYKARLRKISWMSRFIHFKIFHEYFLGYQNNQVAIPSIFGDVIFNEISLAHIYTRHFAAGEKQYVPDQSFFINDFHFNSIHRLILLVLSWIGKENIAINHPFGRAITFKYKTAYYQLYIDKSFMKIKGKGNVEYLVVKSLFPINNKEILNQIEQQVFHKVSGDLTIYEQFDIKGV